MLSQFRFLIACLIAAVLLSGCISTKSFMDPSFPKVSYEDLKKRQAPIPLNLHVEFQRNGVHVPGVDATLREGAERILRSSGVIEPVGDGGRGEILVVVNNIGDVGDARSKGFATGFTFGLVGSEVVDAYEMTVVVTMKGKVVARATASHALHSVIGNATIPEGVEILPDGAGFPRVLEQMLIRALQDLQKTKELAGLLPARSIASPLAG